MDQKTMTSKESSQPPPPPPPQSQPQLFCEFQGEGASPPPPPPNGPPLDPPDQQPPRSGNTVFKSGSLFISSKGIGWTSWKKRWFILTRTSLVFFRSDPSAVTHKGNEVNLTLGGIDLNNSGSVVVKADKKLLTVLFPDGRDGRAFTLKAETLEDLYEWKTALELALAQAPSASNAMGQNGILNNDQGDAANGSSENSSEKGPARSTVIGTPILLALEDSDGTPSFLEKSLQFVEEYGVKVEGILRQAADVEDVERRIREYDQGKVEFSPDEDAHVIADCVKYVIRELPSYPVPASCCNALLDAWRNNRGNRVNAIRLAVCETFPEPNRRLLQRFLIMMQKVASNKATNRMSTSAVAACMAPLLLRPLLAGDCEIETDFNVGGDGSVQLLQAAAAANHAQAIVITLLEEYDKIFGEGSLSAELYSDTEYSGSESDDASYDDESYDDDGGTQESEEYTDDDGDNASSQTCSESDNSEDNDLDDKSCGKSSSGSKSPKVDHDGKASKKLSSSSRQNSNRQENAKRKSENITNERSSASRKQSAGDGSTNTNVEHNASKKLSTESIEEQEAEIRKIEGTLSGLQKRVAEEVKGNAVLQASLDRRKKALYERRLALEKEVTSLQDQLKNERNKKIGLEAGINICQGNISIPAAIDPKMKAGLLDLAMTEADVTKLKQKAHDLIEEIYQESGHEPRAMQDLCDDLRQKKDKQKDSEATATSSVSERSSKGDLPSNTSSRPDGSSSAVELAVAMFQSANSKKSGLKGEASVQQNAMTKLTARLNFLKERRSQIASEIQNMDKTRGQGRPTQDKGRGSELPHSSQNPEKRRHKKSEGSDGESFENTEKYKKSDSKSNQEVDGGQQPSGLDRGKSESHEKKQQGSGGNQSTSRTYSR